MAADTPTGERAASALPSQLFGVDRTVFTRLLDAAPDAMLVVDHEGRIVVANVQAEGLFAATRAMLCERGIEDLLPERFRQVHAHHRQRYFRQPRVRAMGSGQELLGQRLDGSEFPVEVSLSPLDTDAGHWVVAAIRDISARKEVEHALAARNEELEQFSYIASHDLQAPLRTIASFSELLLEAYGQELDEDGRSALRFIEASVQRMSALVRDLLDYSRIGQRSERRRVDTAALVAEVIADLRSAADAAGARFCIGEMPQLTGHRTELRLLFQNLLANAVKFHAEGVAPRIELLAERAEGAWVFTVSDNGIGIAPEHRSKIFQAFQRVHPVERFEGTGIGLAHCRKIVALHGGRIWVEPRPGGGSRFGFTIPDAAL